MINKIIKKAIKKTSDIKMKLLVKTAKSVFMSKKYFTGDLFERFTGMEKVIENISSKSILDIGCCDGLIDYEMVRNGADLVHGFDIDELNILFANRLFRDVSVESYFNQYDLSKGSAEFNKRFNNILLKKYDTVLFLGIYHHLQRQMPQETLKVLVEYLLNKTISLFVVRTPLIEEVEHIVLSNGFKLYHSPPNPETVGALRIYKRN